jgi:cyclase
MLKKRLIACLLLRDDLIVQSFGFNRYLPLGKPRFSLEFLVKWDVDEIVLLDITASAQGRGPNEEVLEMLSEHCYVPLTVGGGIRSVDDVRRVIRAGADKVCINTHAFNRPQLITDIADNFGSQCAVVSMDCLREADGSYQVYVEGGKKATGLTPLAWAQRSAALGAGEILVNSIDRDGSRLGYDIALIASIAQAVNIPVIALGGAGKMEHFVEGIEAGVSAVAAANIFQHTEHSTILAKAHLLKGGVDVRLDSLATYEDRRFDENGRLIMLSAERLMDLDLRKTVVE